jgi:DNA (cytosine-5)-methyltransferase 1
MIKVGSDFSGVGAFDQALIRLGIHYQTIFACDMDKYARDTFIHNYGEPKYYPKNVYEREIPKESLDIYMTSPPCQSFSLAGKRLGKDDKRGVLFFNSHEFIKENKPRFFIFENVKGLLSDDNGNTFNEWVNMLGGKSINGLPVLFPYEDSVDYHLYWQVLNAKKHGVPQNRERVFLVGIRDDEDNIFQFPKEENLYKSLKDVLEENVDAKYFLSENMLNCFNINDHLIKTGTWRTHKDGQGFREITDGNCPTIPARAREDGSGQPVIKYNEVVQLHKSNESNDSQPYQQNRVYDANGLSPCIQSELGRGNIVSDEENYLIRRLTPRECFRLMDSPDTFTWNVSDSQAYKQAGNSIVVNVLYKIIQKLKL